MTVEQHGVLRPSLTTDMDPISQQLVMGAAGSGGSGKLYVEDVFSTWLYTGNGSTQTITNGIDLSGKGGLVWTKARSSANNHILFDTIRGGSKALFTSTAGAELTYSDITFGSTGYSVANNSTATNSSGVTYASWTFREAAKFFDVVTYTGTGANRAIAHSLGSVPGCIIVKRTDTTGDWQVYHRSLANTEYLVLNTTAAKATGTTRWNSTTPTSTEFSLGTDATVNASGGTYVAYLFAHNAGGFGDSGTDSVVNCGTFTTDGSGNATVNLGWEPQLVIQKRIDSGGNWFILDVTRRFVIDGSTSRAAELDANLSTAEGVINGSGYPLPTGFAAVGAFSTPYIYIAIRRGPMKMPTDATKVFNAVARNGNGAATTVTCGFQADALYIKGRSAALNNTVFHRLLDRNALQPADPAIEAASTSLQTPAWDVIDGIKISLGAETNSNLSPYINYFFKRAPSFFDVATYTGTGAALTVNHNLGVVPQLIFLKRRNTTTTDWQVYAGSAGEYLVLNSTAAKVTSNTDRWNNTAPTSSAFTVGTFSSVNTGTYIANLFGSCPGVSKVGTYTGTAATLNVDCGFINGARYVLIKRTDSTGGWYVWDTVRGLIAGNDPYHLLNAAAAEVTNTDYIDPLSSGFQISSTAPADINASGGTYLYLAIA